VTHFVYSASSQGVEESHVSVLSLTCMPASFPRLTGSGTIDVKELKAALHALGQNPSDEEVFVMISQVRFCNYGPMMRHGSQKRAGCQQPKFTS
jgi:hypothetical protein